MSVPTTLNDQQNALLDHISNDDFLANTFYFSGGTALAEVYLHHRASVDLDFFSPHVYDPQNILARLTKWSSVLHYSLATTYIEPTHIYFLTFKNGRKLKIDFSHYPYQPLEPRQPYRHKLQVDSFRDIGANKLLTLTQRTEVKDFVDLYFLLQNFTFWDLRDGVKTKFNTDIDPFIFASDCMVVENFRFLPKMTKPLNLAKLRDFYTTLAVKLGRTRIS
jgi:predicted nucleotidyltransferase component of viral defense system